MASDSNTDPKARNEVEASQGIKGQGLMYVLVGGIALVLVVFAILWAFQGH